MQPTAQKASEPRRYPRLRWYICALLFFATTINYVDRQVMSLLKAPVFIGQLHWTNTQFGWITSAFQTAYAIMMPVAGRVIDFLGPKRGYAIAILIWSLAAMSHSLARSVFQFGVVRFCLGIGESANFPAAIRTVAEWFPPQERALATGLFNSGANVGAIVAPLAVPWIAVRFGWRASFLFTGGLVALWLILWFFGYRKAPTAVLLAEEKTPKRIPYAELLRDKGAWAFLIGKFLTDPVWWFYLFWLPGFLNEKYHLNLLSIGPPLVAIYLAADVGSIAGGWLSSTLLKRGWTVNAARKLAMLVCGLLVTGVIFVPLANGNLWLTVSLIGLAAGAHQGWSANLFTLVSDIFPQESVGSVIGFGGLGGAIGGALVSPIIGRWLDFSHGSYAPLFIAAGSMYLIAFFVIHMLVPKVSKRIA